MIGIRLVAVAGQSSGPIPLPATVPEGAWMAFGDVDAYRGRGEVTWTFDPGQALTFPTPTAAMAFWRSQSQVLPFRPDGRPNRPFTAFTVSIENLPEPG